MRNNFIEFEERKKFFLNYANNSLRDNPEYLHEIMTFITVPGEHVEEGIDIYDDITKAILLLIRDTNYEIVDPDEDDQSVDIEKFVSFMMGTPMTLKGTWGINGKYCKVLEGWLSPDLAKYFFSVYRIAGDTVYGCADCCVHCGSDLAEARWNILGKELFLCKDFRSILDHPLILKNHNKLKCYECDQLHFQKILDCIIAGQNYEKIPGFPRLLEEAYEFIKVKKFVEIRKSPLKESYLRLSEFLEFPITYKDLDEYGMPEELNIYRRSILSMAMHSLINFLINSDRRLLKKCDHCKNYFTATRVIKNQRYCTVCSPKNKMTKEERREYQRDYRPKRKKTLERRKREKMIKKYTESGDTREQAELRINGEKDV